MTGPSANIGGISGGVPGMPTPLERTASLQETQGFGMRPTQQFQMRSTDLSDLVRQMFTRIDQVGGSRGQQRQELARQIEHLEALPQDDPARAELANSRLLATLQGVQELSFRVELATKVVDQVANGLRTITQTPV